MTRGCGVPLVVSLLLLHGFARGAEVSLAARAGSPPIDFGAGRLEEALKVAGSGLARRALDAAPGRADVLVVVGDGEASAVKGLAKPIPLDPAVGPEGYRIVRIDIGGAPATCVAARDETGAMYGLLDLAEHVRMRGSLAGVGETLSNPRFPFRAVKFNLPWMSYRKHEALQLHQETCRDLKFWRRFLDMMADNRLNVLTLWNLHPFTFLIRPKHFPEACGFSDRELAEWQAFWRSLFRMARERGIEPYLVNWNIFVSPEFARARNVATYSIDWQYFVNGDTSDLVRRYTRECVTQVIDEYEDLAGLGISLGEGMGGLTPQEREDWLADTFIAGLKQAKRPVKFIHRAPFSANKGSGGSTDESLPLLTRRAIDRAGHAAPVWVEMKFNWSHGHSSPRLSLIHGGKAGEGYWDPKPANYRLAWMVRNEDFFILRWGEPGFIRKHIDLNGKDCVGGYFVGSECYIPAKNYIDRPDLPGRCAYAFERQWLFYRLWGRLLYDPATPDAVFEADIDARYGKGVGKDLLAAYAAASRMPLRLASFFRSTWDFTLYAEGFLAPAGVKGAFITLEDLIKTKTLDPDYVSIPDYVQGVSSGRPFEAGRVTPPALADALEKDGVGALGLAAGLAGRSDALDAEVADVRAWAHLSLYFADKLRAGVALETFRKSGDAGGQARAVGLLESAARHWDDLVAVTRPAYPDVPLIHTGAASFSWERYRDRVLQDVEAAKRGR
jgi:hypothetical protein